MRAPRAAGSSAPSRTAATGARMDLPVTDGAITAIIVDPLRRIFLANDVHGVLESNDGGATWSADERRPHRHGHLRAGLPPERRPRRRERPGRPERHRGRRLALDEETSPLARPVTSLLVMSTSEIYAAVWSAGVVRFGEQGGSTEAVNAGLQDLYVNALYSGSSGYLFAGTRSSGVFRSRFDTVFWQNTGAGSISREVNAFRTSQFGEIFAGTRNGSLPLHRRRPAVDETGRGPGVAGGPRAGDQRNRDGVRGDRGRGLQERQARRRGALPRRQIRRISCRGRGNTRSPRPP